MATKRAAAARAETAPPFDPATVLWYSHPADRWENALPGIQKLIFEGRYLNAHKLFGRHLMGYPVEQMKFQSLGDVILKLPGQGQGKAEGYRHSLDLDRAVVTTTFERDGVRFRREVFSSPVDQVIVVRLEADRPGRINFTAELRGCRNEAHSNLCDGLLPDGPGTHRPGRRRGLGAL